MRVLLTYLVLVAAMKGSAQADSTIIRAPRWMARAQFAGMQGLISGGLMWNVPDGRLQVGALYGFAPASNGSMAYHGAVLRTTGSWFPVHQAQCGRWSFSPIASISAVLEMSGITFLSLPSEYPKEYYSSQALHGLLGLGARLGHAGPEGRWSMTAEAVTLDTYLWYGIIQRQVKFHNIWNLALGVEYHFGTRP